MLKTCSCFYLCLSHGCHPYLNALGRQPLDEHSLPGIGYFPGTPQEAWEEPAQTLEYIAKCGTQRPWHAKEN